MSDQGLSARQAAVRLMTAVTEDHRLLQDAAPETLSPLSDAEKARARRLATEALRWAQRSDRVLGPYLRNRPEDPVLNALRLAVFELFQEGEAAHGVVNAAVGMTSKSKKGLVNAVLRNVLRDGAKWDALPPPSIPKWLRKRIVAAWGKDAVQIMERVQASPPPLDLTLKSPDWAGVSELGGRLIPTGSLRLDQKGAVSALPGFAEGAWWVQDAAAAIPARLLDPAPAARVLDLCAAPGGKTMQLAAAGATVTALDKSERRMARVAENLERTRLSAELVVADALEWTPETPFDAILLDAPCSATGTLRRHPDLGYAKDGSEIDALVDLQLRMLRRATDWVRPGGRLVFCTCSLLPEEGECQIKDLLGNSPDMALNLPSADWIDPAWRVETGLRIRPDHWVDQGGIDGFFIAPLQKRA
ncbi:MAG: transcription antitermination factor NusB [Paracoccaceae bacterium]|nr:transcription antitermination factor NusB [Paracoccaceae bacterium]